MRTLIAAASVAVLVAMALACGGCERLWEFSLGAGEDLTATLDAIGTSNRMVVKAREARSWSVA
jgi:hypothetical protein